MTSVGNELFGKPVYRFLSIIKMGSDGIYTNLMHSHYSPEILYAFDGKGYMKTENAEIPFCAGDLIIVDKGVLHTEFSSETEKLCFFSMRIIGVTFDCESRSGDVILLNGIDEDVQSDLYNTFESIFTENKNKKSFFISMINYLCDKLFLLLVRENVKISNDYKKNSANIIAAIQYINDHIYERITLDDMAKSLFVNKYSIIKRFNAELGITPQQYIREKKIEKACTLMSFTDLTIEQISEKLGFCSTSHFYQVFKSVAGILPNQFRRKSK